MTHEQFANPAHSLTINDPIDASGQHQYAPLETTPIMSNHGLLESSYSSDHRLSGGWLMQDDRSDESENEEAAMAVKEGTTTASQLPTARDESYSNHRPTKRPRTHFFDFAAQARLQQDYERRKRFLHERKRVLQRSIALSARLQRTSSWVQDGLVQISNYKDPKPFAQVFSYAQDLVDICYSHWTNELNNLDIMQSYGQNGVQKATPEAFFNQLPSNAQQDLLDLLSNLRNNPQFLIDRLRRLPSSQVATLTSNARWQFSDAPIKSFSQDSNRSGAQRRRQLQAYSKELEDYATSFERSNPLSFLLHNLYSYDISPTSLESQLRLYNWSTICADLLQSNTPAYDPLFGQVLNAFSVMQDWPARPRIELFLMSVLQRGAFLINENPLHRAYPDYDPLNTEVANNFINDAVLELWWTLAECGSGCYPLGAFDLAQAILGKISSKQQQSDFRNHFFYEWYLRHFMWAAIMFPENEKMLLKMHVSKKARDFILFPIWHRFFHMFKNHKNLITDYNIKIGTHIERMLAVLDGAPAPHPYKTHSQSQSSQTLSSMAVDGKVIVICASEVIKVLDVLSPQSIHSFHLSKPDSVVEVSDALFRDERIPLDFTHSDVRFHILKQHLLKLVEPGTLAKDVHPCAEAWTDLRIDIDGSVTFLEPLEPRSAFASSFREQQLNLPQKAVLRLCAEVFNTEDEFDSTSTTYWTKNTTLVELFRCQMNKCQTSTRTAESVYWKRALEALERNFQKFAFDEASQIDSIVLHQLLKVLLASCDKTKEQSSIFEGQVGSYETTYQSLRKRVKNSISGMEELRLKIWYTSQIIHSGPYQDARNIASALHHMALPTLETTTKLARSFRDEMRPSTNRSSRSSLFNEPQSSTMRLLKAPTEFGGPRKLADEQIELLKEWLQKHNIDNFCKGEERLHRFCMEIEVIVERLTNPTMNQSPELWYSELFTRERLAYEIHNVGINSAPASTRPASVYSESLSPWASVPRSSDSDVRSVMSDDKSSIRGGTYYATFKRALRPDILSPELASSFGSYGRASSANTSASDGVFSLPSQSVTSASVYSRPPSILNGSLPNFGTRPAVAAKEMKGFLQQLQRGLVCLLLSDLGSLVWSWGCETDTWIGDVQAEPDVRRNLQRRMLTSSLLIDEQRPSIESSRRRSTTEIPRSSSAKATPAIPLAIIDPPSEEQDTELTYFNALGDILVRLNKQVDPVKKLDACIEFYNLAIEQMEATLTEIPEVKPGQSPRRKSLDLSNGSEDGEHDIYPARSLLTDKLELFEKRIIQHLLLQLARLRPETIFRDLQFVAAFAPPELRENKSAGQAFMHLGMAALEYKSQLCNSMVDVTREIVAADSIKRKAAYSNQQHLARAAEYWSIAAREGNHVAQRELSLLYLVHPELLPIVSLPLSQSADIFTEEQMWQRKVTGNGSRQALCLALHWMQQAEKNGDEIAHKKLRERQGQGLSIR